MHPHADLSELRHGAGYVHRIAAEPIELGDDQHVVEFEPIHEAIEAAALAGGDASGNRLGDDAPRLDLEACGLNLQHLIFRRLPEGGDSDIGEGAGHGRFPSEKGVRNLTFVRNYSKLIFGRPGTTCPKTNDYGRVTRSSFTRRPALCRLVGEAAVR